MDIMTLKQLAEHINETIWQKFPDFDTIELFDIRFPDTLSNKSYNVDVTRSKLDYFEITLTEFDLDEIGDPIDDGHQAPEALTDQIANHIVGYEEVETDYARRCEEWREQERYEWHLCCTSL